MHGFLRSKNVYCGVFLDELYNRRPRERKFNKDARGSLLFYIPVRSTKVSVRVSNPEI